MHLSGRGNVRSYSTAEFNFSNDPEAAHIVLKEMQCPITVVPWEAFVKECEEVVGISPFNVMAFKVSHWFPCPSEPGLPTGQIFRHCSQHWPCQAGAEQEAVRLLRWNCRRSGHWPGGSHQDRKNASRIGGIARPADQVTLDALLLFPILRGQVAVDWFGQIWEEDNNYPNVCKLRTPIQFVMDYNVHRLDQMITEAIHNSARNEDNDKDVGDVESD